MSSPSSEANVSCEICEDAKCKKCTTQHIMEAEELWDPIANSAMDLYDKKNARKTLETNGVYKKLIKSEDSSFLKDDPTELEIVIERMQNFFREESNEGDNIGN
ncbi:unnamed protein product [Rotaria magnacalcarata]|uniref:Uncharacterized protein n=1 Tax=Rotaria magnacalcarata TaxID=392030 RepID=A0A8S3I196_9BILA|nr:unnamed protein product [Rotaria magnacalcarata]